MFFDFFVFWFLMVFLLAAEFFFFEEFQSRFNTVAINYLLYPHEVFVNIWESYPVVVVVALVALVSLLIVSIGWKLAWASSLAKRSMPSRKGAVIWTALSVALLFTLRPGETRFSRERSINEIANNSLISLWFAATAWNIQRFIPRSSMRGAEFSMEQRRSPERTVDQISSS